jgi:hypothetical protein
MMFIQAFVPFMYNVDQCMACRTTLDGAKLFFVELVSNCIKHPLANQRLEDLIDRP